MGDIPRLITQFGDVIPVGTFYETIYNATAAHMDDIHAAIMDNSDLEVVTEGGGQRRQINVNDVIRRSQQRSFFPMFLQPKKMCFYWC